MADYEEEFPFEEIRDNGDIDGDYFYKIEQAREMVKQLGLTEGDNHIWSVVEGDGADGVESLSYGPSHHYVNLLGYIITREAHDGETYYHETWERDHDDDDDLSIDISF